MFRILAVSRNFTVANWQAVYDNDNNETDLNEISLES